MMIIIFCGFCLKFVNRQLQRRNLGRWIAVLMIAALGAACSSPTKLLAGGPVPGNGRPIWIDNPGNGVSAAAGFHVNGRQAQEELAIARAREEMAKRLGVKISSEQQIEQNVVGDISSTVSSKKIQEQVNDKEVKAVIKSKWLDPRTDTLWVWLVPVGP